MNKERWHALMTAFNLPPNDETYDSLISAYNEKHRAYHTAEHIEACLRHFDKVKDKLTHPHEVELALWFHDAIYEPFSATNEKDSADWAVEFLTSQEVPHDSVERVKQLILITEHHAETETKDEEYLLDIDLSILGAPPSIYNVYEKNIRREYQKVPRFIFRKKRKAILREFLERDRIYITEHFSGLLETQAKENLARAISAL